MDASHNKYCEAHANRRSKLGEFASRNNSRTLFEDVVTIYTMLTSPIITTLTGVG